MLCVLRIGLDAIGLVGAGLQEIGPVGISLVEIGPVGAGLVEPGPDGPGRGGLMRVRVPITRRRKRSRA